MEQGRRPALRVWGRRGAKVRQRLQLAYEWRYLFAAVDGQAGRVWWNWVPSMKAEALWPTIAGIQEDSLLDGLAWEFPDRASRVIIMLRCMHCGKDYVAAFGIRERGQGPFAEQIGLRVRLAAKRLGLNERHL